MLAGEIPQDLRQLTVHDATHTDALWQLADMIVGANYPVTPTEGFILGGAFLLHDLGMALASYPGGGSELERETDWQDAVVQVFRRKYRRSPTKRERAAPEAEIKREATEQVLRLRHAKHAADLGTIGFRHADRDEVHYLIEDAELRQAYGPLIGRIASSHGWSADTLRAEFGSQIGAFAGSPPEWKIDPLKLALIVRVADACHLDARRAPGFLRALRKPAGESEKHWRFQGYVQTPLVENGRLVFGATKEMPLEDMATWWLCYDMLGFADRELRDADAILRESVKRRFAVDSVAGANDPARLRRYFPTKGWQPIPTKLQVSDVAGLVRNLGGQGLYGDNQRVPLRELIQNARDAVVGRRFKEQRGKSWGEITVRLTSSEAGQVIEVHDSGLGMSAELLTGPFLDFGTSYWNSGLMLREHPGLVSQGFEPQGRFGIGFFSVFMWGDQVKVITRCPDDAAQATRVLEFHTGLSGQPVLRDADERECLKDPGTVVQVWLSKRAGDPGGILGPGPIESSLGFFRPVRREKAWSLRDLCAWLCPVLDVKLITDEDGKSDQAIAPSDWKTMSGPDLLRRLLLHHDDVDAVCAGNTFQKAASILRDIRNDDGELLGRAAVKRSLVPGGLDKDPINEASAVTAGFFRTVEQMEMIGVLIGTPERASRMTARPLAFDVPEALSRWSSEQARLVSKLAQDMDTLAHYALLIRLLGGDTGDLIIARDSSGWLSFEEIRRKDLPNEVLLHEELSAVARVYPALPDNGIAVVTGRMKAIYVDTFKHDPKRRANHPRWEQYWMSLWGAAIEAIALAWGVPLQEVLEASEISPKREVNTSAADARQFLDLKVDIIRNPRATGERRVVVADAVERRGAQANRELGTWLRRLLADCLRFRRGN
ncbi:MAG: ATP-binding protein [Isosphaeraceae bacterium]